jgi:hypothetical protein
MSRREDGTNNRRVIAGKELGELCCGELADGEGEMEDVLDDRTRFRAL